MSIINRRNLAVCVQSLLFLFLMPALAFAMPTQTSGLPFEESFDMVKTAVIYIGGALLIVGIVICGIKLATGEGGGIGGKAMGLVLGGILILGANEIVDVLFTGTSGLLL